MQIKDVTGIIEELAPLAYQESYDNAGLLTGHPDTSVTGALITLDITEEVVEEAIRKQLNLIIAHHPVIFSGIKKLNGNTYTERSLIKAIQHNIAIYAAHTNLDSVHGGVNSKICQKLGLNNPKVLIPLRNNLKKLVTFVPHPDAEKVRDALFTAGAGNIGQYDSCSFNSEGTGTFKGNELTTPYTGKAGSFHCEPEIRIETIFQAHQQKKIVQALLKSHPYEEVAFDIYSLDNEHPQVGIGMIGDLPNPIDELSFLQHVKNAFSCPVIKHTALLGKKITRIAVVGGSGSSYLKQAIAAGADLFLSGDFKYHQFFDAEQKILIADIGHYESEQYTKEVFYELLTEKFPKFAVHLSEVKTNPVNYLI